MQLAVHTMTVAEELRSGRLQIDRLVPELAALGCRAIEIDSSSASAAETARAAADAGMGILYASGTRVPSDADPSGAADEAVATALALGARRMSMLPPRGTPRWDAIEPARIAGVRIHVTNEPAAGSVLRVRAFVDRADRPWVTAAFDTAAAALAGEDPVRSLYLLNRRIGHIYFSDAKPLLGRLRVTHPGDGTLWWYGVMWALWSLGYEEYVTLAFPDEGNGDRCLRAAIEYVTQLRNSRFAGSVPRHDPSEPG